VTKAVCRLKGDRVRLILKAKGFGEWIDAGFDPGVQLQGQLAGIGEPRGRVGADGEGAA
jgi:hypothetical protein